MIHLVARKDVIWNRRKKPAERVEILLGRVVVVLGWVGEKELLSRPCNGDIEEAAFFFEGRVTGFINGALVGEHAVRQPDGEDDVPFQSFGLMPSRERDGITILLFLLSRFVVGIDTAEQGKLAEEFGGGGHWKASGCTIHETFADAEPVFVKAAEKYL